MDLSANSPHELLTLAGPVYRANQIPGSAFRLRRSVRCQPRKQLPRFQDRHDLGLDRLAGDFDVFLADVNVDLGTDTEFAFKIDTRLDRKQNAGGDEARVARLEIIDVHAVAMAFFADGMAGAMGELLAVTGLLDHAAGDIVHLGAADPFPFPNIPPHELRRGIAGFPDDIEDPDVILRHGVADETGP